MTKTMKASECKAKFLGVLDEVEATRQRVIVTKNGKPVAEIVPFLGDIISPIDVEWDALKE